MVFYYQRVDSTLGGTTFSGPVFQFIAPPVSTSTASNVLAGWATLNGSANPQGTATSAYFQYGTSTSYGSNTAILNLGNGNTAVPVSYNLSGLAKGTTYHYRLVIVSGSTTTLGNDQTFTTPASSPPTWHSTQVSALTNPSLNHMSNGARTGAAHSAWQLYFYRASDCNIWCVYWTGSAWVQQPLTTAANAQDWLAFGTSYNLCCYQSLDGRLWCVYWSGAQWVTVQLGTPPVGVAVAGDVVIDNGWNIIYYRGSDYKVYAVQWTGSQWAHTELGGAANVSKNLAVDAASHLVYYQGMDNQIWCEQWTGAVWQQVKLSSTANAGGSLTVDSKGLFAYYRSSVDNRAWTTYWNGSQWAQPQLNASANMLSTPGLASGTAAYPQQFTTLYLDNNGQCQSLYWSGSAWTHILLGDGGSALTGGLSFQPIYHWAFARRGDGNIVVFYYQ
jgi:hypothetical protein